MTDFLKAMPSVTREEYMWEWTIPQIKLAMYDYTHVEYHTDEETKKEEVQQSVTDFVNDLGIPIMN